MGQILHGNATTTEAARRAIQDSQASLRELAARYGINPKIVATASTQFGLRRPHGTEGASLAGSYN